jgi:hypothetical protein
VLEEHSIATAMTCCGHMHTYPRRGLYSTDDFKPPPPPDRPGNANPEDSLRSSGVGTRFSRKICTPSLFCLRQLKTRRLAAST